jgi:tetratricopeptide (TPR) repeat protein
MVLVGLQNTFATRQGGYSAGMRWWDDLPMHWLLKTLLAAGLVGAAVTLALWLVFLHGQPLEQAAYWVTVVGFFVSAGLGLAGVVLAWLTWHGSGDQGSEAHRSLSMGFGHPECASDAESVPDGTTTVGRYLTSSIDPPLGQLPEHLRGRDDLVAELLTMVRHLSRDDPREHKPLVLWGMGGVGKTAVALLAARVAAGEHLLTFWISCQSRTLVETGMAEAARRLDASPMELAHAHATGGLLDLVWARLNNSQRSWLLVFDNADDIRLLAAAGYDVQAGNGWVRPSAIGAVIVTSRVGSEAVWGRWVERRRVAALDRSSGAQLLTDLTKGCPQDVGSIREAEDLSERLGGLPLALRAAGRYLAVVSDVAGPDSAPRTFSAYQRVLDDQFADLIDAFMKVEHTAAGEPGERLRVTATWELSLRLLDVQGLSDARTLLRLLCCYAAAPVPWPLVSNAGLPRRGLRALRRRELLRRVLVWVRLSDRSSITAAVELPRRNELLVALQDLSLVELDQAGISSIHGQADSNWTGTAMIVVHPVVRDATAELMAKQPRKHQGIWSDAFVLLMAARETAGSPAQPGGWRRWQLLIPHLIAALHDIRIYRKLGRGRQVRNLCRAGVEVAGFLQRNGDFATAVDVLTICREIALRRFRARSRFTRRIRHSLAHALWSSGRYQEAEEEFAGALFVVERLLRAVAPSDFRAMHAAMHELTGGPVDRLEGDSLKMALRLWVAILRGNGRWILRRRVKIARILIGQGQLVSAERQLRNVLSRQADRFGPHDEDTLSTRTWLGRVLELQGNLSGAEAEYRAVVETREGQRWAQGRRHPPLEEGRRIEQLDWESPQTLNVRLLLAWVLRQRGESEAAEAELRAVIAGRTAALGEDDAEMLRARHNLAHVLEDRGELEAAEAEFREVIETATQALGEEHAGTLSSRFCLARLLKRRRELEAADAEFRAVIGGRSRALGEDHAETLNGRVGLAEVLQERGQLEAAEAEFRAVIAGRTRALGADHAETLNARALLAWVLRQRGELEAAEAELQAVIAARTSALGKDHAETLSARHSLAHVLEERGELEAGEAEFREVIETATHALGEDNAGTLNPRLCLARLLKRRGELEAAQAEFRAVIAGRTRALGKDHAETLSARNNLADVLQQRGEVEAAEAELRALIDTARQALGEEHAETLKARRSLTQMRRDLGYVRPPQDT